MSLSPGLPPAPPLTHIPPWPIRQYSRAFSAAPSHPASILTAVQQSIVSCLRRLAARTAGSRSSSAAVARRLGSGCSILSSTCLSGGERARRSGGGSWPERSWCQPADPVGSSRSQASSSRVRPREKTSAAAENRPDISSGAMYLGSPSMASESSRSRCRGEGGVSGERRDLKQAKVLIRLE